MRYAMLAAMFLLFVSGCANTLTSSFPKHDFATLYLGEGATSGPIHWTNTDKNPVSVQSVSGTWNAGDPFALVPPNFSSPILPASHRTLPPIFVTFIPTTVGTFSGNVEASATQGGNKVSADKVAVAGKAVAQDQTGDITIGGRDIVPDQMLDFGSVSVSTGQPVTKEFDIQNASLDSVTITVEGKFLRGDNGYTIDGQASVTIPPLQRKRIKIKFKPTSVGTKNNVVEFKSDDGKHVAGTALTGVGTE